MKTLFRILIMTICIYWVCIAYYEKHLRVTDEEILREIQSGDTVQYNFPRFDPKLFKKPDTTQYKGNWVDIN